MAYSSGFSPHPRISYPNASPTSAASEAEYVELGLSEVCDPDKVVAALNEVLPTGFVVLAAADAVRDSLGDLLEASEWHVSLGDTPPGELVRAVTALMAEESVVVERMTKNGLRSFDVRAAIVLLDVLGDSSFRLVSLHGAPLVRPDDVVTALRRFSSLIPPTPALLTRLRQGPLVDGEIGDPLR